MGGIDVALVLTNLDLSEVVPTTSLPCLVSNLVPVCQ